METADTLNPNHPLPMGTCGVQPEDSAHTAAPAIGAQRRQKLIRAAVRALYHQDTEYQHFGHTSAESRSAGLCDFLFAIEDEPHLPDDVFSRLRWGGQFVYISRDQDEVAALPDRFRLRGFLPLYGPMPLRLGWRLPFISERVWCFVARKMFLIRPREISDRFTYHVQLVPRSGPGGLEPSDVSSRGDYIVLKEIPSLERVIGRLRARFTELPHSVIERRARSFTEKIFPLFLTREAAMLKILERDLPRDYVGRFPRLLAVEKDGRGYVQRLWMTWLRNAGEPLSQIEFARQFAELLHVLHDRIGIVHLDLRLDNIVITEKGVGFVDFGSAVRLGENIAGNTLLSTLFEELMRTSQIQRMLERMTKSGSVTSAIMREAYGKVDKAVDVFYLAVQMASPTGNPDLRGLIHLDPSGPEAAALIRLRKDILTPKDPKDPPYRSAEDILNAVTRLKSTIEINQVLKT